MQIKTIPFNLPFLPVLAKYIIKKHSSISPDFGSILIVFPSERNKVYFREYLLQETGKEGIISPSLLTIEQLYDHVFEKTGGEKSTLTNEIERNVLLKEAVGKIKFKNFGQLPFIKFISIGRKLLGFFDELASWNLAIKDIDNVKEKLHFPSQYVDEELPILGKIHKRYEKILNDKGLIDKTSAYLAIAKSFKTKYLKDFEFVYIAGCLALPFTDILLIKKILTDLQSKLIIHCDKKNLADNSLDNIFYHHNKILRMLDADIQNIQTICSENSNDNSKTTVYIQKCKSALDEVGFIMKTISELSPRYPLHRIGVMLPEESFYLPLKDALDKFSIPYNLSMGIPFKHTPLYSFLKDAYDFIDSNFSSSRFLRLLKNPIIKGIIKDGILFKEFAYKLDIRIRKENLSCINRKIKSAHLSPEDKGSEQILTDFVFDITDKLSKDCSFGEYVKSIREIIQETVELNEEFYKKTFVVLNNLMEKLIQIENCEVPDEFCQKGKDKLKFIINVLETMSFPISGDFLNGVQVIGVLEARNIDFDCIIIPSCNEGIFPQKSEKDLFLPANLRKELNIPFYKERDALYCYYFHQLITGKKEVYLSYRNEEKTQLGLKNRWIEKLAEGEEKNFIVKENKEVNSATLSQLYVQNNKDNFYGKKSKKNKQTPSAYKNDRTLNFLESLTFSPSILKTYKQCPYKFYLSYILNMKEPKSIKEGYAASIWGTILHNTLARLYNEVYPEGYTEDIKKQVISAMSQIGEEEFKKAYPHPKGSLCFDWEQNKKKFITLIDNEISHFKDSFKSVKMDKKLTPYIIDIGNNIKVKVGGIPDRIDTKDKKFYIIDYKMSKKPSPKTYQIPNCLADKDNDFTEFQLPLYGLVSTKGKIDLIGGLIYYHLDENRQNFLTLDILEKEGKDYIKKFKEKMLLPILKDIFNKKISFQLNKNLDICQRCIFVDHCGRRV
ncbi:MAG: PD-(D/E)XK nuclease family protein [Candidatus Omnitrophica bacterium]|nr:PD-(D/E)XK nuclease family protein [Candidatus Omnitrophota bacterium]MBU1047441.1 PD-(D/E)XK nuclease family protein [Candidatus Omnitrophota bacterium]MBU1630318.1 PD-(D/E)XK nuclease family protein [Candidatus Omnitrophota bacterium]MBU1767253.1 PD-(D/E)XK nuclease family protein [Candidatus Omnitrophota bacterium]MBU1888804.1 PD-(D/E)XK nuclease family protein [Candidatus Omnitrophota bacterium]